MMTHVRRSKWSIPAGMLESEKNTSALTKVECPDKANLSLLLVLFVTIVEANKDLFLKTQ